MPGTVAWALFAVSAKTSLGLQPFDATVTAGIAAAAYFLACVLSAAAAAAAALAAAARYHAAAHPNTLQRAKKKGLAATEKHKNKQRARTANAQSTSRAIRLPLCARPSSAAATQSYLKHGETGA